MTVSLDAVADVRRSTTTIGQSSSIEKPQHDIKVESASIEDANAMADVGARSFGNMTGQSVPDADLEVFMAANYSAPAMMTELKDPGKLTLVARTKDNNAIVGIIQLVRGQTDACLGGEAAESCCLQKLYVDPFVHGKGVGTRLIGALEERARAEGFKQIWLTVWEENPKAHRLYERLGYRKAGETGFWFGTLRQNDWVYLKAL
ncbi:gnat family protein acetyltransferase [Apiospora saccharicola]|uniref:Gnat family protein acetyltransferase n=1 Tax=Apiospora saccharicola TaxID=335842 RepID=A0ABR1WI02_9PEZI